MWRCHVLTSASIVLRDQCHVLSVVEGKNVLIGTANGMKMEFHYAETFCIPAAAGSYTVTNLSEMEAMLLIAFIK